MDGAFRSASSGGLSKHASAPLHGGTFSGIMTTQIPWPHIYDIFQKLKRYIRNGGKEVKLFASALKAFQCNNRIVMAQRKHLDVFLRGRIIGLLECGHIQLEVSGELGIAQSVISRL
ncbi:uncharacterized protein TNCV_3888921 [Trichonephila clavipes]|nr:uncharacterized protein TNCV_3888921 [Trichonephila clavipes]